jgi:hypothetical protein
VVSAGDLSWTGPLDTDPAITNSGLVTRFPSRPLLARRGVRILGLAKHMPFEAKALKIINA